MHADSIIKQLAAEPDLFGLPGSWCWDNSDAPGAAARLHCFAGKTKWLLVGEELYFDEDNWGQHDGFTHVLHCYGTASNAGTHIFPTATSDGDAPLFIEDEDGAVDAGINPSATTMRIRDTIVPIPRDPTFLAKHGIASDRFEGASLYRALCSEPRTREILLATPQDVRRALEISKSLSLILTLDSWASPELSEDFPASECARLLADVIVSRDPARYQPSEPPNMHWRQSR